MTATITRIAAALALAATAAVVQAAPVTFEFHASGFQSSGTPHPEVNLDLTGSFSWDRTNVSDPVGHLTAIDITIAGHHYTLGEVGIGNEGSTQTAFGANVRGTNAVVGDGAFNDFLIVFDRVNPRIDAFAVSIQGAANAIWWFPTNTSARIVDGTPNGVPEPAGALLAGLGLVSMAWQRRRHGAAPASPSRA